MNVVVTIFYAIAIAWFVGLAIFAIVKKVRAKKSQKKDDQPQSKDDDDKRSE